MHSGWLLHFLVSFVRRSEFRISRTRIGFDPRRAVIHDDVGKAQFPISLGIGSNRSGACMKPAHVVRKVIVDVADRCSARPAK